MRYKLLNLFFVFVLVFSSFEPVMAAEVSAPFSALDEGMEAVKQTWDEIWKKNKCPNNYYGV